MFWEQLPNSESELAKEKNSQAEVGGRSEEAETSTGHSWGHFRTQCNFLLVNYKCARDELQDIATSSSFTRNSSVLGWSCL